MLIRDTIFIIKIHNWMKWEKLARRYLSYLLQALLINNNLSVTMDNQEYRSWNANLYNEVEEISGIDKFRSRMIRQKIKQIHSKKNGHVETDLDNSHYIERQIGSSLKPQLSEDNTAFTGRPTSLRSHKQLYRYVYTTTCVTFIHPTWPNSWKSTVYPELYANKSFSIYKRRL